MRIRNQTHPRETARSILVTVFFGHIAFAQCGAASPDYWQLVLAYNTENVTLIEAAEIAPMKKKVRTPGLKGAPGTIDCVVEWLGSEDKVLITTETSIPLGKRVAEKPGDPLGTILPPSGTIVVRLAGPEHGVSVPRLIRFKPVRGKRLGETVWKNHKAFQDLGSRPLPIGNLKRTTHETKVEGPFSATKVRDTGDDGNRLVLVITGDGYTEANHLAGDFDTDVNDLIGSFDANNAWSVFADGTNIYQLNVESNEEGSDKDPEETSPPKDTYFNSSFWTSGIDRLLSIDQTGELRAIDAADNFVGTGVWDVIAMLVNSETYGGSGGDIVVTSVNQFASDIMLHEFGHTFGGLADEYTDPFPGYPAGDPEPNVDFDSFGPLLKWFVWVERGTPLPTPDEPQYDGVVGAFEGARYLTTGIYRPTRDCLMRTITNPVFCPICKETHILEYFDGLSLEDDADPSPGSAHKIGLDGMAFTIDPLPLEGFMYEWSIGGQVLPEADEPGLKVAPSDVAPVSQEL